MERVDSGFRFEEAYRASGPVSGGSDASLPSRDARHSPVSGNESSALSARSAVLRVVSVPPGRGAGGQRDLGVGDLVLQQGVQLGGLGAGVAQAAAHGFDGHLGIDQLGGMGVAERVDAEAGSGLGAVALPAVAG